MLFASHRFVGELLEAFDEGLTKAAESVAARGDGGVLTTIEMVANLFGRVDSVVEIADEGGDGTLEVDVVLPERVVGVDEEGLAGGMTSDLTSELKGAVHRTIISLVKF